MSLVSLEKAGNPRTLRNYIFTGHIEYNLIIKISFRNGKEKERKSHFLGTCLPRVRLFHVPDFMNFHKNPFYG